MAMTRPLVRSLCCALRPVTVFLNYSCHAIASSIDWLRLDLPTGPHSARHCRDSAGHEHERESTGSSSVKGRTTRVISPGPCDADVPAPEGAFGSLGLWNLAHRPVDPLGYPLRVTTPQLFRTHPRRPPALHHARPTTPSLVSDGLSTQMRTATAERSLHER